MILLTLAFNIRDCAFFKESPLLFPKSIGILEPPPSDDPPPPVLTATSCIITVVLLDFLFLTRFFSSFVIGTIVPDSSPTLPIKLIASSYPSSPGLSVTPLNVIGCFAVFL